MPAIFQSVTTTSAPRASSAAQRLGALAQVSHVPAGAAERHRDDARHARLVVDDEDPRRHAAIAVAGAAGSRTVKRAPPPRRSPTSSWPPCASTIWRAIGSRARCRGRGS
jgi:hypothetical protein